MIVDTLLTVSIHAHFLLLLLYVPILLLFFFSAVYYVRHCVVMNLVVYVHLLYLHGQRLSLSLFFSTDEQQQQKIEKYFCYRNRNNKKRIFFTWHWSYEVVSSLWDEFGGWLVEIFFFSELKLSVNLKIVFTSPRLTKFHWNSTQIHRKGRQQSIKL